MNKTKELIEVERKHWGLCAWIKDHSYRGGRIYHEKFIGYSISRMLRVLRAQGVICPKSVYERS